MVRFLALILVVFVIVTPFVSAQTKPNSGGDKRSPRAKTKKPARIISLGVLNGRAIDLVTPEYPAAGLLLNVYGQVEGAVVLDEDGHVVSATVLTGHPLLRAASIAAARKSSFEPLTVKGEQVRVSGIIDYNYLARQWNWLEVGYTLRHQSSYYSAKNLVSELPAGFSDETRLLRQVFDGDADWDRAIESITAIVRARLSSDSRSTWLFETGMAIAAVREKCCRFDEEKQKLSGDLNVLIISAPETVSADLLSDLRHLNNIIEKREPDTYSPIGGSRSYELLNKIERQFPFLGR
jgi:hypothetical protein